MSLEKEKIEKRFRRVSRSRTFRNIVEAFGLDKKRVFDVGCSYGEHLAHFGAGSVGVTVAPEEAEYGRSRGLDARQGNIEEEGIEEKFEAVFCNNLLEHLYSPHGFLIKVKKFLEPEGKLILGVPCLPRWRWFLRWPKWQGSLAGAHINFFTRETLIKTVERAGFRVEAARGFRFRANWLDQLLNPIYPHFYVVARVRLDFDYSEKRKKELAGYKKTDY